jgi:8-oxo-dGTP pyrophosphatase MutT (NUDIX family)
MKSAKTSVKEKAGAVVYKDVPGAEPLVLLVTARKLPGFWVFPVGSVEQGESLPEAAARECQEESGYCVNIGKQLAVENTSSSGRPVRFTFYLATSTGEADNWEQDRQRKWVPISQAAALLPEIFQSVAETAAQQLEQHRI